MFSICIYTLLDSSVGDEAAHGNDSSWGMDCSTVLRVKTIHISSPILAAKSPFFYKVRDCLFSYVMFTLCILLFTCCLHAFSAVF